MRLVAYLLYNKDLLISESGKDIFQLFFDLAIRAGLNHEELEPINKEVKLIIELVEKLKIYIKVRYISVNDNYDSNKFYRSNRRNGGCGKKCYKYDV